MSMNSAMRLWQRVGGDRDLDAEEPFDHRERQEDEVEGEGQRKAREELEGEARSSDQIANDLVEVGILLLERFGNTWQLLHPPTLNQYAAHRVGEQSAAPQTRVEGGDDHLRMRVGVGGGVGLIL